VHSEKQCYNKHRLVSDQRPTYTNTADPHPGHINQADYQWANEVLLSNPTQSSNAGDYTATRALSRQQGRPFHAYANNLNWPSSCSITQNEGKQWWQADFTGGERTVRTVRIVYEIPN